MRGGGKLLILPHVAGETETNGKKGPLLSASLDFSGAERSSTGQATEYAFPGGGRVVLLANGLDPDCKRIAPAIRIPNAEEQEREAAILKIVRQLLGE